MTMCTATAHTTNGLIYFRQAVQYKIINSLIIFYTVLGLRIMYTKLGLP